MMVHAFNLRKVDASDFKVSLVYIASSKSVRTCLKKHFPKARKKILELFFIYSFLFKNLYYLASTILHVIRYMWYTKHM